MNRFCVVLLTCFATAAAAQTYPDRPVRVIVPFSTGSAVDTIARVIGAQMAEQMGQQLVIENRTGANGIIAAEAVVKSPADGYTLFFPNDGMMAANPAMFAKIPYDPIRDFAPVTLVSSIPLLLVAHPSLPVTNVQELVALAKSKPGTINYGTSGNGSAQHLAMALFASASGAPMTHVPYKSLGAAFNDLLGGHIPVMFAGMSNVVPLMKDNKLRVLAVSSARRSPALPEVPTAAEQGVPGYGYAAWNGIVAPAGTPAPVIAKLHAEMVRAMANPAVRGKLAPLGFELIGSTPAEFGALIRSDVERIGALIRASGIKAE